jgi:Eukaryotic-type carbonic anhydrase
MTTTTTINKQKQLGWDDKVPNSQGWQIGSENHCIWCPASGNSCGSHHSSPINNERNRAVIGHPKYNICIDPHWLSYHDSSCSFDELRETNSFVIDRHALKIIQPIDYDADKSDGRYKIKCSKQPGVGRRWGRADFPKGFSQWWFLSHIDFKVPSEHTQEGKRYAAELQLHHVYSVTAAIAGVDTQIGGVSILMDVYQNTDDWPELNRVICAWREAEEKNRRACGLPSIEEEYPGCYAYARGHSATGNTSTIATQGVRGRLLEDEDAFESAEYKPASSAMDMLMENLFQANTGNATYIQKDINFGDTPEDIENFDWDAFIAEEYKKDEMKKSQKHRHLMNYNHVPWFNYFPMLEVRTEYFYRYSGAQTTPPCYGKFISGTRAQTYHWRVFKDPIRVTQRQIDEMHRLLRERIAPKDDKLRSCQKDTAAATDPNDPKKVSVARPLQSTHEAHFQVFCECINWRSKFMEDQNWCKTFKDQQMTRFYDHPYNFKSNKFEPL